MSSADDLALDSGEAEVLAFDAAVFARALSDDAARARYELLAASASSGLVPAELVGPLEAMLELLFEKGRPSNRAILQAIFAKTPRGRQRSASAREVNEALRTLRGQTLAEVRVTAGPARHTLVIETDACRLTLELDAAGTHVTSLETG